MLWIEPQPLATVDDLRAALQNAIQLEHSTIAPYLTALYTLKPGSPSTNFAIRVITDIVVEEMLHMTLACNILNAIGGRPVIADAHTVPQYPSELPMGVAGDLVVHLRRYSKTLVEETFMKIEEPEHPLDIPTLPPPAALAAAPITIGQFYAGISDSISDHPELFTGTNPARQVSGILADDFAVTNVDTALLAIKTIVEQGEGTSQSPLDLQQDFAHYYAFQQFSKGMRLVKDPQTQKVSFDPARPIAIDDHADVIEMVDDPSTVTYDPADAHAEELAAAADVAYSDVLRMLQRAFNGEPDKAGDARDLMAGPLFEAVDELLQQQLTAGPLAGQFAGPRYRYIP